MTRSNLLRPEFCRHCATPLVTASETERAVCHQIIEVPEIRALVQEHRMLSLGCPCCGKSTRAELAPELKASCFGPRLAALVATCTVRLRLSKRGIKALFEGLWDVPAPSLGMIRRLVEEASAALLPAYRETREAVRRCK